MKKLILTFLVLSLAIGLVLALSSCEEHEHDITYKMIEFPADCKNGGYTIYMCSCGYSEEGRFTEPTGHIPSVVPGTPATCYNSGTSDGSVCSACGETLVYQEPIPAAHTNVVIDEAVAPTCKTSGLTEGSHCEDCGNTIVEQSYVPQGEHNFANGGDCTMCGAEFYTAGLQFSYDSETDSYTVTSAPDVAEVVIPSTYEGKPVTTIGKDAFKDKRNLQTVKIPDSVTKIMDSAFMFSSIDAVVIPKSVTYFGEWSFYGDIEDFYYDGTVADWCKLTFQEGVYNPMLNVTNFYFLDENGDVTHEGKTYSAPINLVIPDGVTAINDYAFSNRTTITSITIPDSVTSIGVSAFAYCTNIEVINFGTGLTSIGDRAFEQCDKLITLNLPEGLTTIGHLAFYSCNGLTTLYMPSTLRTVGESAFSDIYGGQATYFGGDIEDLLALEYANMYAPLKVANFYMLTEGGDVTFDNNTYSVLTSVTVPASVTKINDYLFYRIGSLTEIELHDGITYIGSYSLYDTSITEITFPASLVEIGEMALPYTLVSDVILPEGLTTIGKEAIHGNYTVVYLPSTLQNVGADAFSCDDITTIYFGGTLAQWCTINFNNSNANPMIASGGPVKTFYIKDTNGAVTFNGQNYATLGEDIVIPEGITKISSGVFAGFTFIKTVSFPSTLEEISSYAFYKCTDLDNIRLPESLDVIGNNAFAYCRNLKTLILPTEMTSIGSYAFYSCSIQGVDIPEGITVIEPCTFEGNKLTIVELPTTLVEIKERAFLGCKTTSVVIPEGVTSIGWYAFASCSMLTHVVLPTTLTFIDYDAFQHCNESLAFFFNGTAEQFGNVNIDTTNTSLTPDTVYYYSATAPTTSGRYWYWNEHNALTIWN